MSCLVFNGGLTMKRSLIVFSAIVFAVLVLAALVLIRPAPQENPPATDAAIAVPPATSEKDLVASAIPAVQAQVPAVQAQAPAAPATPATPAAPAAPEPPAAKPALPVPQTPEELEALLDKLGEIGPEADSDSEISGLGPIIRAIGQATEPRLVPVLTQRLSASPNWKIKAACVLGLANFRTSASNKALEQFFKATPLVIQSDEAAAKKNALVTKADWWLYHGAVTTSARILVDRGRFPSIKDAAKRFNLYPLMADAGKPGLDALVELALDAERRKTHVASEDNLSRAVGSIRSPECLKPLRKCAQNGKLPLYFRIGALEALAEGFGPAEYPTIIAIAKSDPNPDLATVACHFASKLKPAEARPELIKFLQDKRPLVRGRVAYLLGTMGDKSAIPEIEKLLAEPNDDVRLFAVRGLWLLDYTKRKVNWKEPTFEGPYGSWMESHPKPEAPAEKPVDKPAEKPVDKNGDQK